MHAKDREEAFEHARTFPLRETLFEDAYIQATTSDIVLKGLRCLLYLLNSASVELSLSMSRMLRVEKPHVQ